MEALPHGLRRDRHVDLADRGGEPWMRRALIALLTLAVVIALLGVVGQTTTTLRAQVPAATLTVKAPTRLRGGLFFQGRLDIVAHEHIHAPRLELGNGWTEQMQLNTIEPSPATETSSDGRLELGYDPMASGDHLTIWMQFEVNPTAAGRRDRSVTLLDGTRVLAHLPAKVTVAP
ncbi:MAG TPA: hypothetical protein VGF63_13290 [Solirubrobacteraceae bacterium]|jgi:hypothetical protein